MLLNYSHEHIAIREYHVNDSFKVKGGAFDSLEGEIVEKRGSKLQVLMEKLQVIVHVDLRSADAEKVRVLGNT